MKKFIKGWIAPLVMAILIVIPLQTFVISVDKVKADVLTEYNVNSKVVINKLDKNVKVGDIVDFKKDNERFIRKVITVNTDTIIVSDKNGNKETVSKSNIVGKAVCKVF